ncbi:MAG: restriction endonuclease subunit S [Treponema sp.]|nr:restriction endonuclease subunit S [Treponema sp.]
MAVRLGKYIEQVDIRNSDNSLGEDFVIGVSTQKEFIKTKADLEGVSLTSYKQVSQNSFVYVPDTSRRGDKIALAYNSSEEIYLVSAIYTVFKVKDDSLDDLIPDYLFLYFNRPEFDRYARFHSWGSAREVFSWDDMCEIEIELPPVSVQQNYVNVYNAMLQNQKVFEKGLNDLKLINEAYVENLRHKIQPVTIGSYIKLSEEYNVDLIYGKEDVMGMTITKEIIPTKANLSETSFEKYIIVKQKHFIYNPRTHGKRIGLGFNNSKKIFIISWNNIAFHVKEEAKDILLPEYLFLFFKRDEWDRWACFNSWGSSTEVFAWDDLCETKIPIPDISIQQAIVNIFNAYNKRKAIVEKLKRQIKGICPILVRGAMGEAYG